MALQNAPQSNIELPQTGDNTEVLTNVGITVLLAAVLAFFIGRRQKKEAK